MTPTFKERLKEKLHNLHGLPSWNVDDEVAQILSLVRGIVSEVYKKRYPELGDAPIEVMHFANAILNEIGEDNADQE